MKKSNVTFGTVEEKNQFVYSNKNGTFELKFEGRLHFRNKNKIVFILYFAQFALPLHLLRKLKHKHEI